MNNLVTTNELHKKLKLSLNTLENFRKDGMPHVKLGYRTVRYDMDKVNAWLELRHKEKAAESE